MLFPVFPDLGWWAYILIAVFLSHPITMSVTLHLHRSSTHGSVKFHPVINGSLRFISWFFTGMKEREWVSVNRKHHMHADRAGDPHSPLNEGLFRMLWKGVVLYRREAKDPTTIRRYGYGTSDDWVERHIFGHRYFCWSGVVIHFFLEAFLFGWKGILIWGFLTIWIPTIGAWGINGLGHRVGYRSYALRENARNIVPWGILAGGEELHNNHHAHQGAPKFSIRWWEFDLGWAYIRTLSFFRLASYRHSSIPALRTLALR